MTLRAKVRYADFKGRIAEALKRNKNRASKDKYDDLIETEKEYRRLVGLTARDYRDKRWGSGTKEKDARWQNWVGKLEEEIKPDLEDEGDWKKIASIDSAKINNLVSKESGFRDFAFAIHFRMHRDAERPIFAKKIDERIWGASFEEEFQEPVFEDVSEAELPASFPTNIKLDASYQPSRPEFIEVKKLLLSKKREHVALTAAIQGFGGYGKTAIAEEICLDEKIQEAFSGGIYWLQFGLAQNDAEEEQRRRYTLAEAIDAMLARQYPPQQKPNLNPQTDQTLLNSFLGQLPEKPVLIVADDLWTYAQSVWIERLPTNVSVLVTSRIRTINPVIQKTVEIEHLSSEASIRLLSHNLVGLSSEDKRRLRRVSDFFRGWALLLRLANATARIRYENGWAWSKILSELEEFTRLEDIQGWDDNFGHEDSHAKRRNLVGYSIKASLDALPDETFRFAALSMAVFPEDTEIPFTVLSEYWQYASKGPFKGVSPIKSLKGRTIRDALHRLSIFRNYDTTDEFLKIHDIFLRYFQEAFDERELSILHKGMVDSIGNRCNREWHRLPPADKYGWENLHFHLENAGLRKLAARLLGDYRWIRSKLFAAGYSSLTRTYGNIPRPNFLRAVARCLAESGHVLSHHPSELPQQVFGRLGAVRNIERTSLMEDAISDPAFTPKLPHPHLVPLSFEQRKFSSSGSIIFSIALSRDEKILATGSGDGAARLWDLQTGELIGTLVGHQRNLFALQFDRSGEFLLTAAAEPVVRVWRTRSRDIEFEIQLDETVFSAKLSPDSRYVGVTTKDSNAIIFDTVQGEPVYKSSWQRVGNLVLGFSENSKLAILKATHGFTSEIINLESGETYKHPGIGDFGGRLGYLNDVSICSSSGIVLSSYQEDVLEFWNYVDGHSEILELTPGFSEGVSVFAVSAPYVALVSYGGFLKLYHIDERRYIGENDLDETEISRIIFNQNNSNIAVFCRTAIIIIDLPNLKILHRLRLGHSHSVYCAEFSATATKLVTGSGDGFAQVWDFSETLGGECPDWWHRRSVTDLAVCEDRNWVATCSEDNSAQLLRLDDDNFNVSRFRHSKAVRRIALEQSGELLATACSDGYVRVWDVNKQTEAWRATLGHATSAYLEFSRSGQHLAVTFGSKVIVYEAKSGIQIQELEVGGYGRLSAHFSPCSRYIVAQSQTGLVTGWDLKSWRCSWENKFGGSIRALDFSSDGNLLLVSAENDCLHVLQSVNGSTTQTLEFNNDVILDARFGCEDRLVLAASQTGIIYIWNQVEEKLDRTFSGHEGAVWEANFVEGDAGIVSYSSDKTVRFWDITSGEQSGVLRFDHQITELAVCGDTVIVGDTGGGVTIVPIEF